MKNLKHVLLLLIIILSVACSNKTMKYNSQRKESKKVLKYKQPKIPYNSSLRTPFAGSVILGWIFIHMEVQKRKKL